MVYSSPADISRPQGRNAVETTAEEHREEGGHGVRGVHWDPQLVSYSQPRGDSGSESQPSHTTSPPRSQQAFSGVVREKSDPAEPSQQVCV